MSGAGCTVDCCHLGCSGIKRLGRGFNRWLKQDAGHWPDDLAQGGVGGTIKGLMKVYWAMTDLRSKDTGLCGELGGGTGAGW